MERVRAFCPMHRAPAKQVRPTKHVPFPRSARESTRWGKRPFAALTRLCQVSVENNRGLEGRDGGETVNNDYTTTVNNSSLSLVKNMFSDNVPVQYARVAVDISP